MILVYSCIHILFHFQLPNRYQHFCRAPIVFILPRSLLNFASICLRTKLESRCSWPNSPTWQKFKVRVYIECSVQFYKHQFPFFLFQWLWSNVTRLKEILSLLLWPMVCQWGKFIIMTRYLYIFFLFNLTLGSGWSIALWTETTGRWRSTYLSYL